MVSLNGTLVDVWVEIPLEYTHLVSGPVTYNIDTAKSVERCLMLNDAGYNLHGSRVRFLDHSTLKKYPKGFQTTFTVSVPLHVLGSREVAYSPVGTLVYIRLRWRSTLPCDSEMT